jgi:hypothetical protein
MAIGYDLVFFENSDGTIFVEQLRNEITGALVSGATVEAIMYDDQGLKVVDAPDPITFTEDSNITATYTGQVPDTADLSDGDTGTVVLTADDGAGLDRQWTLTYIVHSGTE